MKWEIDLTGSTALVTGAGQNVGQGIAYTLASAGASVVINCLHQEKADAVAEEISAKTGAKVIGIAADITSLMEVQRMVETVESEFGQLDILVNNAGIVQKKPFEELSIEDWDRVMNVSVKGSMHCVKAALPLLKKSGKASVIFISADCANRAIKHYSVESASRGAINSLAIELAGELAPHHIRVNVVVLGPTGTPTGKHEMGTRKTVNDAIPLGRIGFPEDIGNAITFLVSDKASYITGAILPVDGGRSILGPSHKMSHSSS